MDILGQNSSEIHACHYLVSFRERRDETSRRFEKNVEKKWNPILLE